MELKIRKLLLALIALCGIAALLVFSYSTLTASFLATYSEPLTLQRQQFVSWMHLHKKQYFSEDQFLYRFEVWKNAKLSIEAHNSQNDASYVQEMNHFGDLTKEEFKMLYLGMKPSLNLKQAPEAIQVTSYPSAVNWVDKGAVTPIKDQGGCGSCWAFSATGSLEGKYFLTGNKLTSFSEQQLVECSHAQGNEGCNGGFPEYAFDYLKENKIETEADYPYTGYDISCQYNAAKGVTTVPSYTTVAKTTEALSAAVANQPVSIGIDAENIQFYRQGIIKATDCDDNINHGVLVVGYDIAEGYWLVKNSWSVYWGEKGYGRFEYGKNTCAILDEALYPQLP